MDDVYGLYMHALETWYLLLAQEEGLLLVEEDLLLVEEDLLVEQLVVEAFCRPKVSKPVHLSLSLEAKAVGNLSPHIQRRQAPLQMLTAGVLPQQGAGHTVRSGSPSPPIRPVCGRPPPFSAVAQQASLLTDITISDTVLAHPNQGTLAAHSTAVVGARMEEMKLGMRPNDFSGDHHRVREQIPTSVAGHNGAIRLPRRGDIVPHIL